jgi:hypothetical protein
MAVPIEQCRASTSVYDNAMRPHPCGSAFRLEHRQQVAGALRDERRRRQDSPCRRPQRRPALPSSGCTPMHQDGPAVSIRIRVPQDPYPSRHAGGRSPRARHPHPDAAHEQQPALGAVTNQRQ